MNLVKIFDLVKCSRNNVSCNADILTIDDARNKYKDCQYAVVNVLDGMPVWILFMRRLNHDYHRNGSLSECM